MVPISKMTIVLDLVTRQDTSNDNQRNASNYNAE